MKGCYLLYHHIFWPIFYMTYSNVNNIFAISPTPVVIDYETLFFPNISEFKEYDVTEILLLQTDQFGFQTFFKALMSIFIIKMIVTIPYVYLAKLLVILYRYIDGIELKNYNKNLILPNSTSG
jgi:hypothetical protein